MYNLLEGCPPCRQPGNGQLHAAGGKGGKLESSYFVILETTSINMNSDVHGYRRHGALIKEYILSVLVPSELDLCENVTRLEISKQHRLQHHISVWTNMRERGLT